jgi:hypothetical protein
MTTATEQCLQPLVRRSLYLIGVVLLLLCGRNTSFAQEQNLFPENATVLILVGLAGDVESETTYRDHLSRLLGWLKSHPPKEIILASDFQESPPDAAPLQLEFMPARRDAILNLKERFAARTEPLCVFAWGHGGFQGKTPVFHVRGPRLTAEDFKGLADALPAQSTWFLFFKGSGTFAQALSGRDRIILSTDRSATFNSDPIGAGLAMQGLRERSNESLKGFAEAWGHAVVDWFEERQLARTEEPTLWWRGDKPQSLVPAEADKSLAAAIDNSDGPSRKPNEAANRPASAQDVTLSDAWKSVRAVSTNAYPGAEAVVLARTVRYTLGESPAIMSEQEHFIQILTPEGKRFGDFEFHYNAPEETLEILDCELLRPDGAVLRISSEEVREASSAFGGHGGGRKFFSMSGVGPGAILRVHLRREWKTFPLPHIFLEIPLESDLPVVEAQAEITVPAKWTFHHALANAEGIRSGDPEIRQSNYGTIYHWRWRELPAPIDEALAPPGRGPALLVSTFPDWAAFADWYARIIKLADAITPEISNKAAELTRLARTDREKVEALYAYVTRLRYVAVPLGVNSFRPHAAANVLRNQFGDCKDKANLFNSMLRAIGLEAHLVLVPRFAEVHEKIPGLAFNHAISRIKLGSEFLWVDTTDEICRLGFLPPGDPGRKVLVIDGSSARLSDLPKPEIAGQRLNLTLSVQVKPAPAMACEVKIEGRAEGIADYKLRSAAMDVKADNTTEPLLERWFGVVAGRFICARQSFTPVSQLQEDFRWQGEGEVFGILDRKLGGEIALRAPFWLPRVWERALHARRTGIHLNDGYPLRIEQQIEFAFPKAIDFGKAPEPMEQVNAPLRWKLDWAKASPEKLIARLHLELLEPEISRDRVGLFQSQLKQLYEVLEGNFCTVQPAKVRFAPAGARSGP